MQWQYNNPRIFFFQDFECATDFGKTWEKHEDISLLLAHGLTACRGYADRHVDIAGIVAIKKLDGELASSTGHDRRLAETFRDCSSFQCCRHDENPQIRSKLFT